tara:strand:+ start:164 stop:382 length:219 start_codon:yes stop_codon:yes gene_type:complete
MSNSNVQLLDLDFSKFWDLLVEYSIATEETLRIVTHINGASVETLNDVLEVVTAFDYEQFCEEEEIDLEELK